VKNRRIRTNVTVTESGNQTGASCWRPSKDKKRRRKRKRKGRKWPLQLARCRSLHEVKKTGDDWQRFDFPNFSRLKVSDLSVGFTSSKSVFFHFLPNISSVINQINRDFVRDTANIHYIGAFFLNRDFIRDTANIHNISAFFLQIVLFHTSS
jgi:hypothetical protein